MDELSQVGPRLKAIRQSKGWTLDRLAALAGVSASTISRLESGKRQASLELLLPLTRHLDIRIDDLIPTPPSDPRVRRASIRRDGLVIVPLTPDTAPVQAYRITYPPGVEEPRAKVHDGYEWLYVLSGKLHLRVGQRVTDIDRGEAAEFDTRMPHAMWAAGSRPAQVISIFNGSGDRLSTHMPIDPPSSDRPH